MALIQVNIAHCPEKDHPKGLTLTVAWYTNFGIIEMLVFTGVQAHRFALVSFAFMFGKKEIYRQIDNYGKDRDMLTQLAKFSKVDRIQNISLENLKGFYETFIAPTPAMYFKIVSVKQINKFLREYGVPFIMRLDEVYEIKPSSSTIESMKKVSPFDPTPKMRRNKRIVKLIDSGSWSYSDICAEYGLRSKATVHEIYHREKARLESQKLSTEE